MKISTKIVLSLVALAFINTTLQANETELKTGDSTLLKETLVRDFGYSNYNHEDSITNLFDYSMGIKYGDLYDKDQTFGYNFSVGHVFYELPMAVFFKAEFSGDAKEYGAYIALPIVSSEKISVTNTFGILNLDLGDIDDTLVSVAIAVAHKDTKYFTQVASQIGLQDNLNRASISLGRLNEIDSIEGDIVTEFKYSKTYIKDQNSNDNVTFGVTYLF